MWEVGELVADLVAAEERVEGATVESQRRWQGTYGDDPLSLSVPGMGPKTAPTVRAFMCTATHSLSAKETRASDSTPPTGRAGR